MTHDLSHISPVWGRVTNLVVERGEGSHAANTGHSHPIVVKAVQEQAAKIMHAQVNCYFHEPLVRLSHLLIIVFQGSFHGRTAQTMAMTTAKTVYAGYDTAHAIRASGNCSYCD